MFVLSTFGVATFHQARYEEFRERRERCPRANPKLASSSPLSPRTRTGRTHGGGEGNICEGALVEPSLHDHSRALDTPPRSVWSGSPSGSPRCGHLRGSTRMRRDVVPRWRDRGRCMDCRLV